MALSLVLPIASAFLMLQGSYASSSAECVVDDFDKADCGHGSEDSCAAVGCCWKPAGQGSSTPWCYYKAGVVKVPHCTLKGEPQEPFSKTEIEEVRKLFDANLNVDGSGMVVASPDHHTGPGGDYFFAWMRDGALSMNALLHTAPVLADIEGKMDAWVSWVERSVKQSDPHGDIMAEPKFVIPSGLPYPGGWCRPQNDGPGLRAITLMAYAAAKPAVAMRVWESVKRDLDWVSANYTSDGCDLWEEIHSSDLFWNRYTMRKALLQGSDFAKSIAKDVSRATVYADVATTIANKLDAHVDSQGFVFETVNRKLDTAVIEAFNVGDLEDGLFAPLSNEVITTLVAQSRYFCRAFKINQQAAAANISGILFGRYQGDGYAGGNPWVLLTASVATLLYRQADALSKGATVQPKVATVFETLLGQPITVSSLMGAGDAILNRMKTFLTNGMHMNEQIDRNTGVQLSAKDLTWNYANILKAVKARSVVKQARFVVDNMVVV